MLNNEKRLCHAILKAALRHELPPIIDLNFAQRIQKEIEHLAVKPLESSFFKDSTVVMKASTRSNKERKRL